MTTDETIALVRGTIFKAGPHATRVEIARKVVAALKRKLKVTVEVYRGVAEVTKCPGIVSVTIDDKDGLEEDEELDSTE